MPLDEDEQQFVTVAQGYAELGMFLNANEELEKVDPFLRGAPDVLEVRLMIYKGLRRWELMKEVASKLAEFDPDEPRWVIDWAHATRFAESIESAKEILERALETHPREAEIHFTLACYECLLGNIDAAKERLSDGCRLDGMVWRKRALEDPDVGPLWSLL